MAVGLLTFLSAKDPKVTRGERSLHSDALLKLVILEIVFTPHQMVPVLNVLLPPQTPIPHTGALVASCKLTECACVGSQ